MVNWIELTHACFVKYIHLLYDGFETVEKCISSCTMLYSRYNAFCCPTFAARHPHSSTKPSGLKASQASYINNEGKRASEKNMFK